MTGDGQTGAKANWTLAVAVSLAFHAIVIGGIVALTGSSRDPAPSAPGRAQAQTPGPAAAQAPSAKDAGQAKEPAKTPEKQQPSIASMLGFGGDKPQAPQTGSGSAQTAPAGDATEKYTVKPGDSLSRIASRRGCTVQELAKMNGISPTKLLNVGEVLKVPANSPLTQ